MHDNDRRGRRGRRRRELRLREPGERRTEDRRDGDLRGIAVEPGSLRASPTDLVAIGGLGAALLVFFLSLYVVRGYRFPVGPDAPVYLWWVRLAARDGLSAVGQRPGAPALVLVLSGTLHLSPVSVVVAMECVVGTAVGLGAAALLRARSGAERVTWVLGGLLAGTFAAHLATGYLANLVFGALFLAAAAALALGTRRATAAAGATLGAAGLAHPLFFVFGLGILAITALMAFRTGKGAGQPWFDTEPGRIGVAAAGGGALLGVGLLAMLSGPAPLAVDTSKDAFLRRAGLSGELRSAYLDRFVRHWARYVQWASIPLAVAGLKRARAFAGRLLRPWGALLIVGVVVALVSGWAPADRFVAFGYVVPILSALGLLRLWRAFASRRRALAAVVTGALTVAMLAGAAITWRRQQPFMSPLEIERATRAGRYAAATSPATPLVFLVETGSPTITFYATQAANAIRAAMPPDRIRDVYVLVRPVDLGSSRDRTERDALVGLYLRDAEAAVRRSGGRALVFDLAPFDRPNFLDPVTNLGPPFDGTPHLVGKGVAIVGTPPQPVPLHPLQPTSRGGAVVASLAVLALLCVVGYGWSRAVTSDRIVAISLASPFGAAGLILVGIALERLGVPLDGWAGPTAVSGLVGVGGYLAAFGLQRHAAPDPPKEVEPQPDH